MRILILFVLATNLFGGCYIQTLGKADMKAKKLVGVKSVTIKSEDHRVPVDKIAVRVRDNDGRTVDRESYKLAIADNGSATFSFPKASLGTAEVCEAADGEQPAHLKEHSIERVHGEKKKR